MAKLTLTDPSSLSNEATFLSQIAANNSAIEAAVENTLSRDGTSPNTMEADFDMNSHRILNLPEPVADQEPVRKVDVGSATITTLTTLKNQAAASQVAAATSETNAASSAAAASTSATNASTSATNASTSATNAASSASAAATSATNAAASAGVIGAQWTFDTSTVMGDPGTGKVRFNNATVSSVTAIALSYSDAETGNPNIKSYVLTWDDSTNTSKGYLVFRKLGTPSTYAIFLVTGAITDNTTWAQVTVSHVGSSGAWSAADSAVAGFTRAGDKGADGTMTGPGVSVDSEIALYSGTTGTTLKRATTTGILKATSGVLSPAVSGTDYAPATSGSAVLKGNGAGGTATATAGTDYVKPDTTSTLTAGYNATSTNGGSVTGANQTITPVADSTHQNFQHFTLNGSSLTGTLTFAVPTTVGTWVIEITNGGTGAVGATLSTATYTKVTGDTYATTNGNKYMFFVTKTNSYTLLHIQAMQ